MRKRAKKKNRLLFLILFFAVVILIGQRIYQRYSFTNERVDLNEYIGVSGKDVVIYLNDEKQDETEEQADINTNNSIKINIFHLLKKINLFMHLYPIIYNFKIQNV